ncbi:MAG TPA: efflux RND transporter permease subunit [Gemmataceae bacterium]|nr:efflux RND transporter permease subunit [Gemmataceae bacterium]
MWLIKASLRNPYMVATIVFMILFLGIISLDNIPKDILPVFKAPAVQVITYYQGMPASSIEKTITNRIERWVNQSPGAMRLTSKSVPGVSIVRVYFRDDIDPNGALTMTGQLALGTLPTLPPNTLPPVVLPFDPTATIPLGVLTVSNPSMDEANVKDLARIQVRNALGSVKGCVAPVVVGGKDRTILVYLRPNDMEARDVSATDVVEALKHGNMMTTPGIAYFGDNQLLLDSNLMADKIDELMDLPIRAEPGNQVYLRDIGEIRDSATIQTSRVRIATRETGWEGKKQVYVPIYRQQGASSLTVVNDLLSKLPDIQELQCPPGTKLDFVMDQTIFVRQSIHSLVQEGVVGAVLVSIMILIFLGNWRMTLIASMSIPLAILGAIICLYITGNTINAMSLGGLALAIGPLVDDAIVELENNHRNYNLGKSRVRAALDGCVEVMVPVLVATCTTNIVLAPVALQPGMGGFLFRPLALAVTFAMFSSFLLSRTFVPMMCAKFLPDDHLRGHGMGHGRHEPATFFGRMHHRIEHFLDNATRTYQHLLSVALRHRAIVLGGAFGLFLAALTLIPFIGREFFPQVDAGQITIYFRAPSYMRLDATEKRVAQFERFIKSVIPSHEMEMIVSELGLDPDWSAAYTANSGQQDVVVRVQLQENRSKSAQEYAADLRHEFAKNTSFADLRVSFDTGGLVSNALNNGASSPIDIQVYGGGREACLELAKQIRNRVSTVKGVADARVLQRLDAPYLFINVNRPKAAELGLSPADVINQAVSAMNSSISINRNFWVDTKTGNQYFVAVQYPEYPSMNINDLLNIEARGSNQKTPIKLSEVTTFERKQGAVEIRHDSLTPVFNVQMNLEGRDIGHAGAEIKRALKALKTPAGMHWETKIDETSKKEITRLAKDLRDGQKPPAGSRWEQGRDGVVKLVKDAKDEAALSEGIRWRMRGEYERMNESFVNLALGLAGAAVLVYLLQVALFRSWVGPFIIMFTVPLGLIGVLTMLLVTRTTLNVQSEMGFIFLVGIAVNNGVLLVEFANKQRKAGRNVKDAIVSAAGIRFRPIMMTFLATFLDLIPMAIGLERGSEANVPLARAVVGGLLTSTCLTFFVVPIMFTLLIKEGPEHELDIEAQLAEQPAPVPAALVPEIGAVKPAEERPLQPLTTLRN